MPRRAVERLEKVVSTKISMDDYELLEKYAKIRYNQNKLPLPTISHMLRHLISGWANLRRKVELARNATSSSTQSRENSTSS